MRRNKHRYVFQIVHHRMRNAYPVTVQIDFFIFQRRALALAQHRARRRIRSRQPIYIAFIDDMPPIFAATWPELDHVVGALYHIGIVLDDDERVPHRLQRFHHADEFLRILRMQTRRRLVEDVERIAQPSPQSTR